MDDITKRKIFEELYDTYAGAVYKIAYSILKDKGQAEDAVHDTFIKLMPHLQTLKECDSSRTKSYISIIVKNTAINQYRKNQREYKNCVTGLEENMQGVNVSAMPTIMAAEDRNYLKQLLGELDSGQREIIELHCFYELSYKEIAGILEISEAAAGKRFERAKQKVKSIVKGKGDI